MFREVIKVFEKYKAWLITILLLNVIFVTILWLLDSSSFFYIFPTMLLGSILLYFVIGFIIYRSDQRKEDKVMVFLENPDENEVIEVINLYSGAEKAVIQRVLETLQEKNNTIKNQRESINEYVEYIESWAHEIKTPLALMTFILDNRKEEISPIVYKRLEYVRTKIQENIERMLYYARLKSSQSDYFFEKLSLKEVCCEIIEEYEMLLQEHEIEIITKLEDLHVISDKKGLLFLIRQVISNAIKYKKGDESSSFIEIFAQNEQKKEQIRLTVRDNGIGIKPYDLPLIFEKGFTGEIGEQRKNSTGMGLYLVKQVADHLKIKIDVSEEYTEGLEISFLFPKVVDM